VSDTGMASGADDGWLAKVLAGDALMCSLLDLARTLPADEWAAFVRCGERIAAGVPAADAEAALWKEVGRAPA
jgi:hypothetical protein